MAIRDIELSCDERVVHELGLESRRAYALSLLKMEETRRNISAFASGFSKNAAGERLRAIMRLRKTTALRTVVSVFLVMCSLLAFCTCTEAAENDTLAESPDLIRIPAEQVLENCGEKHYIYWTQDGGFVKLRILGNSEGTFGFFLCSEDSDEAVGQWITLDGSNHVFWLETPGKGNYCICVIRDYERRDDEADSYKYQLCYTTYAKDGNRVNRWDRHIVDGSCRTGYIYTKDMGENIHPEYDSRF